MIGDMIRQKRKEKGISLSELSRMTGVSKSYLSYLERGMKKNPSIDVVKRIFQSLNLPITILTSQDDNSTSSSVSDNYYR
ncbi:helix-turn-helix domain-containing protein [Evansella tamaricis]|uniref:Helix-turn-helix transcriptional regulator n=1 Tax=Evansella tamaricis TaxID=2069301 RepID=A0ABS6JEK7_9BACI|nr:helix-turn-helix transcriptional regulator [Evansella tamaricis]MBU9712105.1 helix-turn-helix transcriptional regulator [Evansella tamaricis]